MKSLTLFKHRRKPGDFEIFSFSLSKTLGSTLVQGLAVCYLGLDCRFWAGNEWWKTPPLEQKKIVRDERTTERDSIDCGLLDACEWHIGGQTFLNSSFGAELLGGVHEAISFVGG